MSSKTIRLLINGIACIPLIWITILYLFTLVCWLRLGHFPVPSLDDPKYIGFSLVYFFALAGMFMIIPVVAIWVLLLPISVKQKLLTKKFLIVMVVGSTASLLQLFLDPFDLIYWLLD